MGVALLRRGPLIRTLTDWSPLSEGFFLDGPGHRQVPPARRAFIAMIRGTPGAASTRYLPPKAFLVSTDSLLAGAKRSGPASRARAAKRY